MYAPQPDATEAQRLRNITDCNLCFEAFRDPRILPCFHTFCLSCISQAGPKASERLGEKMPCPLCRKEFPIPSSGFEGLQKNLFVQRMTEARKLLDRTSGQIPCDTCNGETIDESDAVAITVRYCLECNLNLCEQCCAHHRRSRLTKEHTLREGASLTPFRESDEALGSRICRRHTDEEAILYYKACLEVSCPMCFNEGHQGHERLSVVEAGDDFRRQIQVSIIDINECTLKATAKKEFIERKRDRITKRTERLEKEVLKRRDDLKQLVDEHARLLLEKLETNLCEQIVQASIQNADNEKHLVSIESYKDYSSMFVAHATNGELCSRAVSDLKTRATELFKENDGRVQRQLNSIQLSFTATELDKFSNLVENIVGNIEEVTDVVLADTDDDESEMTSAENAIDDTSDVASSQPGKKKSRGYPVLVQTLKTDTAAEESIPIWGATSLNNELYIVTKGCSIIDVYDLTSLSLTRKWNLKMLRDPQDITSCAKEKCLYVMDWNLATIFKVDPNGILITEWSIPIGGGRLSVTHESNVLLTAHEQNKLFEFRADGRFICDITLSWEDGRPIAHPQHAVKLINGDFIVSHGAVPDPVHRVSIVDGSGRILKSIGGKPGSTIERLNVPLHLAVDSDGSILVADWNNSRVLLLNSQLEYVKELLSKRDGLRHPGRICINESNGQLVVVDNLNGCCDGQVHIFDI